MTKLESKSEKISQKGLAKTGEELSNLKSWTGVMDSIGKSVTSARNKLSQTIHAESGANKGNFEYKKETQDKESYVYSYIVKKGGKPKDVVKQAVKQGIANQKEGIMVTDANGKAYDKDHKFSAGDEVYVKVPKNISNKPNGNRGNSTVESTNTSHTTTANGGRNNLESKESSDKQVVSEQWMYDKMVEYGITDKRQIAYILATVKKEAPNPKGPGFKNRIEDGKGKGHDYGKVDSSTGHAYYGRGFIQLTHKDNYKKMTNIIRKSGKTFKDNSGKILKGSEIDLVNNPDIILQSNDLSAYTVVCWMKHGFTGKKLSDYVNDKKTDYVGARRTVNRNDCANEIAKNAKEYERKLGNGSLLA